MIGEFIRWAMIPCPRLVRHMGYPAGLVAIEARARRQAKAWAPHLEACHQAILQELQQLPEGRLRRAVVLGSGPLLDIPVEALAARFDELVLVDIVHAPWIMRAARARAAGSGCALRFMAADVSGVIEAVADHISAARLANGALPPLPHAQPKLSIPGPPAELVISACLLSQLPAMPLAHIDQVLRAKRRPDEAEVERFHDSVQEAHLALLPRLGTRTLLTTDIRREIRAADGRVTAVQPLVRDGLLPEPKARWQWHIIPPGERADGGSEIREVGAFRIG